MAGPGGVWHTWLMLKWGDLFKLGVTASVLLPACGDDGAMRAVTATNVTGLTEVTATPGSTDTPTGTPTTSAGTTEETGTASASEGTTDAWTTAASGSDMTGEQCVCNPGDLDGCEGDQILVCSDDCQGFEPQPCPGSGQTCKDGACGTSLCSPGQVVCEGLEAEKTCNASGDAYDPPVQCGATQQCSFGGCTELCDLAQSTPSSVGCSFLGNRMDNVSNS